jgi:hypothetical protein
MRPLPFCCTPTTLAHAQVPFPRYSQVSICLPGARWLWSIVYRDPEKGTCTLENPTTGGRFDFDRSPIGTLCNARRHRSIA